MSFWRASFWRKWNGSYQTGLLRASGNKLRWVHGQERKANLRSNGNVSVSKGVEHTASSCRNSPCRCEARMNGVLFPANVQPEYYQSREDRNTRWIHSFDYDLGQELFAMMIWCQPLLLLLRRYCMCVRTLQRTVQEHFKNYKWMGPQRPEGLVGAEVWIC